MLRYLTQDMFQCHTFVLMVVSGEVLLRQTVKFCGISILIVSCKMQH